MKSGSYSEYSALRIVSLLSAAPVGKRLFFERISCCMLLKNILRFLAFWIISVGGMPILILNSSSSSFSSTAGNRGLPVTNSARMQPKDHMSTAWSYGRPSTTSGLR